LNDASHSWLASSCKRYSPDVPVATGVLTSKRDVFPVGRDRGRISGRSTGDLRRARAIDVHTPKCASTPNNESAPVRQPRRCLAFAKLTLSAAIRMNQGED